MKTSGITVAGSNASWRQETFVFVNRKLQPARRMYPRSSRSCKLHSQLCHEAYWSWRLVVHCSLKVASSIHSCATKHTASEGWSYTAASKLQAPFTAVPRSILKLRAGPTLQPQSCKLHSQLCHEAYWSWGLVVHCSLKAKFHINPLHQAIKLKLYLDQTYHFESFGDPTL